MKKDARPAADQWRPQYHFSAPVNWLNDPNGMVYHNGIYHLMYQYHPGGIEWGPMHWGHATSRDLVHWEHRPVALYPDENGMIFSGCAVVDHKDSSGFFEGKPGLVAVFTHHTVQPDTGTVCQSQSLAYSRDEGQTWIKYADNPVLKEPSLPDFRDPKVFWHDTEQCWVMVLAAGDHIRFYASRNLKEWSYTGEFGRQQGSHHGVWECPDLFELPVRNRPRQSRWVLVVSIGGLPQDIEGSRTQYFLGRFEGGCFIGEEPVEKVRWMDGGRDNYAGVTWSDAPDGRRIWLGWMSNWKYAALLPAERFRGAMTLPRELELHHQGGELQLRQLPVSELAGLRAGSALWEEIAVSPQTPFKPDCAAELLELLLEWEWSGMVPGPDSESAYEAGIRLWTQDGQETRIGIDARQGELYIDRTASGESSFHPDFACRHSMKLAPGTGKSPKLRIWADRISVEVFAGEGELAMTDLIYPAAGPFRIEVYTIGGNIRIRTLNMHKLHINQR
ncbi:glycoside hydrolase family 32 protein [Paenibacillus sp. HW567]|uniref:glycoside hydrolase family 32 protein n=1 Tax=Paenibacillus sp. HW567 TaxID=1034769 RepID=UPI00055DE20D|nr:glycoside hydrolase family 32 protein [Paenibacillus sp. HW567]